MHVCERLNGVLEAKSNKRNETKYKKRKTGVTFERSRQDKVDNEQEVRSTMRHTVTAVRTSGSEKVKPTASIVLGGKQETEAKC